MIQTRTATHKSRSRWNEDEGPEGSNTWDKKCDKTMAGDRRVRGEGATAGKGQKDALSRSCHSVGAGGALSSKSCHTVGGGFSAKSNHGLSSKSNHGLSAKSSHTVGGGLSRIKNALSRSVHGSSSVTPTTKSKPSCRPETSFLETSVSSVAPKDLVNFAEQNFTSQKNESVERRSKPKSSFKRRNSNFDQLADETDDSSDDICADLVHHVVPHKSASLRVLPQTPRPNPPRMCASMTDLGARGGLSNKPFPPPFGRRDSLPPRYGSKTRSVQYSESPRSENKPLPVHLAAEKVANQKITLDRSLRRSPSPVPGRPPRAEGEKKRRSSATGSTFNQNSFAQLEMAFGEEDTLDHYFEMVKASPAKSPSVCGPRSAYANSPGINMVLPLTSDSRTVFSPSRSPTPKSNPSRVSPKSAAPRVPQLTPSPAPKSKRRPSLKSALAANDAASICAAQLEIPSVYSSKEPLSQLQVQYNLYEQMKHSSLNLMEGSFVTRNSDMDTWDLDQILTAKVK